VAVGKIIFFAVSKAGGARKITFCAVSKSGEAKKITFFAVFISKLPGKLFSSLFQNFK
jgi:hypothetical protein